MSHGDEFKASKDVVLGGDAHAVTLKDVAEDMTTLLMPKIDISPLEGLIPRSPVIGAPSLYFFPDVAQHVIPTMLSKGVGDTPFRHCSARQ